MDRLAKLGELAREKVERVFVDAGVPVQVCGAGPVLQPYFIDSPVHDHRAVRASDLTYSDALHRKMYEAGIYKSFSKTYLGLIHEDDHIGELADAMRWAVRELGISATALARKLQLSQPAISISVKRGEKIARDKHFDLLLR